MVTFSRPYINSQEKAKESDTKIYHYDELPLMLIEIFGINNKKTVYNETKDSGIPLTDIKLNSETRKYMNIRKYMYMTQNYKTPIIPSLESNPFK